MVRVHNARSPHQKNDLRPIERDTIWCLRQASQRCLRCSCAYRLYAHGRIACLINLPCLRQLYSHLGCQHLRTSGLNSQKTRPPAELPDRKVLPSRARNAWSSRRIPGALTTDGRLAVLSMGLGGSNQACLDISLSRIHCCTSSIHGSFSARASGFIITSRSCGRTQPLPLQHGTTTLAWRPKLYVQPELYQIGPRQAQCLLPLRDSSCLIHCAMCLAPVPYAQVACCTANDTCSSQRGSHLINSVSPAVPRCPTVPCSSTSKYQNTHYSILNHLATFERFDYSRSQPWKSTKFIESIEIASTRHKIITISPRFSTTPP